MTGILKDFNISIAYLDDTIIFRKTPEEHLTHIRKVFEKLHSTNLSMKLRANVIAFLRKSNT